MEQYFGILMILSLTCCVIHCKVCHRHKTSHIASLQKEEQIKHYIEAKINCSLRIATERYPTEGLYCNITFDNVMCWPYTPAGSVAIQNCPDYINKFNTLATASRLCMPNGEWFYHDEYNTTWSNYSGCLILPTGPSLLEEHLPKIRLLYNVGYAISLASLIVATFLILILKKLHCHRNTIHVHLFVSFILRSIICFLKDIEMVPPGEVVLDDDSLIHYAQESNWKCKLVYSIFHYLLTANYMWIFVEGLYLYTLIFVAVFQKKNLLHLFVFIGWGSPLLCVIPWVFVRAYFEDTMCWNTHDQDNSYYWIIKGPVMATVIINFFFFVNIIRVLFTKLTAINTKDPQRYRKLAKSILVLIPLFGVYYIIYVGIPDCLEDKYQIIRVYSEMIFNSFQGFVVAMLFCFMNGEVRSEIRNKWKRHLLRRQSVVSILATSIGTSIFSKDRSPSIVMNDVIQRGQAVNGVTPRGQTDNSSNSTNCRTNDIENGNFSFGSNIRSSQKTIKYSKIKRNESGLSDDTNITEDTSLPFVNSD